MEKKYDRKDAVYEDVVKEVETAEENKREEYEKAAEENKWEKSEKTAADTMGENMEDREFAEAEDVEDTEPSEPVDPLEFVGAKSLEELEELEFWEAYGDLLRMEDQKEAGRRKAEMDAKLDELLDDEIRKAFEEIVDEEYANRPKVPKAQFSEEFERRMQSLLYDEHQMEPEEKKTSRLSSVLALFRPVKSRRAVVVVAALMVLLVGMTAGGANPIIVWLHDSWMEQHGDYVEIENRENATEVSKESFQKYELTELPEGYKLNNEQFYEEIGMYYITYVDEKGNMLMFEQCKKENGNSGNITAGRKDVEEVKVNGLEGYYVKDSDTANLVLSDGEYMLVFTANLSKEQFIELAEGLQIKE